MDETVMGFLCSVAGVAVIVLAYLYAVRRHGLRNEVETDPTICKQKKWRESMEYISWVVRKVKITEVLPEAPDSWRGAEYMYEVAVLSVETLEQVGLHYIPAVMDYLHTEYLDYYDTLDVTRSELDDEGTTGNQPNNILDGRTRDLYVVVGSELVRVSDFTLIITVHGLEARVNSYYPAYSENGQRVVSIASLANDYIIGLPVGEPL